MINNRTNNNNGTNGLIRLLPYQKEVIQAIELAITNKKRSAVVYIPTGLGKSHIMATLLNRLLEAKSSKRILLLAYCNEISLQRLKVLKNYVTVNGLNFDKAYHVYSGNFQKDYLEKNEAFVYVSTVQSVQKQASNEDQRQLLSDTFDTIILDDYSRLSSYKILDYFNAIKIGFASNLNNVKDLIYKYSYEQAVEDGYLVDYAGKIDFPYTTKQLGEIAQISLGKAIKTAKIAINRTGSKIVWLDEIEKLKEHNNIYISTDNTVNPYYLFLFFTSNLGRKSLDRITRGAYIPHISVNDLSKVLVILPGLDMQKHIVDQALGIKEIVTDLKTIVEEGENSIKNSLFKLDSFQAKLDKFSQHTQDIAYQGLPFPIAVVYRKFANAPNNTQKFSLMIELFESVLRFIVLVNLKDYLCKLRSSEDIQRDIPLIKNLTRPSLGDWAQLFNSLARIKTNPDSEPFLKEVKEFNLDRYRKVLQEFVEIRNLSLRGHGGTLSEEEYAFKVQEYFPKLEELISSLGFLSKYNLVKTHSLEKVGDFYKISLTNLMGGITPFEHKEIESRRAPESNKVIYFNSDLDYLDLDPFVILELCPECRRSEVLLLDKFDNTNISYFGPESGHKPAIANAYKLPSVIKQFAERRSP